MPDRRAPRARRQLRALAAASLLPLLVACAQPLEPAYDQKIVDNLEALTFDTAALFERLRTAPGPAGLPARDEAYIDLAARAATIRLLADARPLPEGFLSDLLDAAAERAAAATGGDAGDYANATSAFMEDYLTDLRDLAEADREAASGLAPQVDRFQSQRRAYLRAIEVYEQAYERWIGGRAPAPPRPPEPPTPPEGGMNPITLEALELSITDILRDALFYEREVLNRAR
ncbi:MAG: hypothetical protein AAF676_11650 [Pseudomonadota bacterium]